MKAFLYIAFCCLLFSFESGSAQMVPPPPSPGSGLGDYGLGGPGGGDLQSGWISDFGLLEGFWDACGGDTACQSALWIFFFDDEDKENILSIYGLDAVCAVDPDYYACTELSVDLDFLLISSLILMFIYFSRLHRHLSISLFLPKTPTYLEVVKFFSHKYLTLSIL